MDSIASRLKKQIKVFLKEADHPITLNSVKTCMEFIVENAAIILHEHEGELYPKLFNKEWDL